MSTNKNLQMLLEEEADITLPNDFNIFGTLLKHQRFDWRQRLVWNFFGIININVGYIVSYNYE
jgi:hypothetical protein